MANKYLSCTPSMQQQNRMSCVPNLAVQCISVNLLVLTVAYNKIIAFHVGVATWCNGVLSATNPVFPIDAGGFDGVKVMDCWLVRGWTDSWEFKNCPCIPPDINWLLSPAGWADWRCTPENTSLCGWRVEFTGNWDWKEDRFWFDVRVKLGAA